MYSKGTLKSEVLEVSTIATVEPVSLVVLLWKMTKVWDCRPWSVDTLLRVLLQQAALPLRAKKRLWAPLSCPIHISIGMEETAESSKTRTLAFLLCFVINSKTLCVHVPALLE